MMAFSQHQMPEFDQHTVEVLFAHLKQVGYTFICPSPETQARVWRRKQKQNDTNAQTLEGVFGWNFNVHRAVLDKFLPEQISEDLLKAKILTFTGKETYRARIRISNFYLPLVANQGIVRNELYIHSAFPGTSDSVFFGPDTYLYLEFISNAMTHLLRSPLVIADVCCGSGAGAIHLARLCPSSQVLGLDLNTQALRMGTINATCAGTKIQFMKSDLFEAFRGNSSKPEIDLIISNPPYIASAPEGTHKLPVYAEGGTQEGLELSVRIIEEGKALLAEGGLIMIYTGVAISINQPDTDAFLNILKQAEGIDLLEYRIIHPDMWSEEIGHGKYSETGRIQVIGAVLRKHFATISK